MTDREVRLCALVIHYQFICRRVDSSSFTPGALKTLLGLSEVELVENRVRILNLLVGKLDAVWGPSSLVVSFKAKKVSNGDMLEVWNHWVATLGSSRNKLMVRRQMKIEKRLESYTKRDLMDAIDGLASSSWHIKENHTSVEFLFKSDEQVERFMAMASKSTSRRVGVVASVTEHQADPIQEVIEAFVSAPDKDKALAAARAYLGASGAVQDKWCSTMAQQLRVSTESLVGALEEWVGRHDERY